MSTILLVDDELSILNLMATFLEPLGHRVLKASAVEHALQQFEESDGGVNLVIVDVNLPRTSGIRLAVDLQSLLPNLGIVLTSGHTPDMWNHHDLAALNEVPSESVAILLKPFLPAALLQTVSRFVSVPFIPGRVRANAAS